MNRRDVLRGTGATATLALLGGGSAFVGGDCCCGPDCAIGDCCPLCADCGQRLQ